MLKKEFNLPLTVLKNQGHNGVTGYEEVIEKLRELVAF